MARRWTQIPNGSANGWRNWAAATLYHTTVGDQLAACAEVFGRAIARAELVVASGGLGPTADDLTRQALAQATGRELQLDAEVLEHVRECSPAGGGRCLGKTRFRPCFPRAAG